MCLPLFSITACSLKNNDYTTWPTVTRIFLPRRQCAFFQIIILECRCFLTFLLDSFDKSSVGYKSGYYLQEFVFSAECFLLIPFRVNPTSAPFVFLKAISSISIYCVNDNISCTLIRKHSAFIDWATRPTFAYTISRFIQSFY